MDVKINAFAEALRGFVELTALDLKALAETLDARIIDGLENGKAQKFEYTMELCWKAIKVALREQEGIDEVSPKKVIKAWYLTGHVAEDDYLALIQAVDDRNKLSHVYDQDQFQAIIARLPDYAALLSRLLTTLAP
ncbi:HI0074 family nucleotidyltransferase substrate-binding subunit [Thiocapsa sp.]|uniref:HI0074 family nucleotidyltransferase substrate-binding subunit n=1 Tax=Thiocapsa sp. TaxID=2024551 RepID=UPI002C556BC1|nr:HI0074 family nucleotidyltransferase substrate-binding subunit [Thiocapsa sp.]HSO81617.1 HI0074 family nucleotidyltransferase substrate-binding subunit [Thiocapsa sp.]